MANPWDNDPVASQSTATAAPEAENSNAPWNSDPVVAAPKIIDPASVHQLVQSNQPQAESGTQQPPVTFPQALDTGMGMPVSKMMGQQAPGTPPPDVSAATRAHYVDGINNGTVSSPADYAQQTIPAVANSVNPQPQSLAPKPWIDSIIHGVYLGLQENAQNIKQTGQVVSGQTPDLSTILSPEDAAKLSNYRFSLTPDMDKILTKTAAGIVKSYPEMGGAIIGSGVGAAAVGGPENPLSIGTIPAGAALGAAAVHAAVHIAPMYADALKQTNGDSDKAWQLAKTKMSLEAPMTGLSFAAFEVAPFQSVVKNMAVKIAAQPVVSATQTVAGNVQEGKPALQGTGQAAVEAVAGVAPLLIAHAGIERAVPYIASGAHPDLKALVGKVTGKDPASVTPQDIDQTTAQVGQNSGMPHPQDFTDTAKVMGVSKESLQNVYKAAAIPPDQIFADTQNDPSIAVDLAADKIPQAYADKVEQETGNPTPPPIGDENNNEKSETTSPDEQDYVSAPKSKISTEGSGATINPLSHILNPAGLSESARDMATALRQSSGPAAHDTAVIQEDLRPYVKDTNKMSEPEQLALINYIENRSSGAAISDPKMQALADKIRDIYSQMADKVRQTFPDVGLREDYFTHQYEDEDAAKKFFGDFVSKQGSERNIQERSYPTLSEAMAAGLKPKTTNPIDTVMNYVSNMNNLISAHRGVELAKEMGVARYFTPGEQPEGWVPLNGNLSEKTFIPKNSNSGEEITTKLYAPEDAARVYNNDISEKASGPLGSILDTLQQTTNFANKLVLGLSGYHFTATTMAAMSSDIGRALTGGSVLERAGDVARAATAPISSTMRGGDIINAYLGKGDLSPDMQKALDLAIKNNAIAVKQQDYWKAGPAKDFIDSFRAGTIGKDISETVQGIKQDPITGTLKAIIDGAGSTMDTISKPLFDVYIPRIKNAALIDEIHDWLQKNPNADEKTTDRVVQDIGNSIDNRFGEMMRENLFWHQYTRQTLQTALLSYSWVTGAARMLKGIPDIGMSLIGKQGLSSNARYLLGMAATYAVVNGVRTYIGTGQAPNDWKDLIYPKTGGTTAQGRPEREVLPSHIGQYTNYLHQGIGELGNEASPALKLMYHLLANSDFRGLPITNGNNPWYSEQRWGDYLKYVLHEEEPIGLKSFLLGQKKGSKIYGYESALGAKQAPEFITDPEDYDKMMEKVNNREWGKKVSSDKKIKSQYEDDNDENH